MEGQYWRYLFLCTLFVDAIIALAKKGKGQAAARII